MSNHLKTEGLWGTMYETYNNLKYNTALLVYSAEGADFHEIHTIVFYLICQT